ncbi:MAG: hypothetical protein H7A39_06525 [Chlamydiales bacterium]|nr:hypothetical protein [Chlamydiales bacterium]
MGFFDIFRTPAQNTVVATEQAKTRDVAFDATAELRARVSKAAVAANGSGAHMQAAIARNIAGRVQANTPEQKETTTLRVDAPKPLPQMTDDYGFITPNEGEREASSKDVAAARATNLKLAENERPVVARPDFAREAAARVAQRRAKPLPPTPTTPPAQPLPTMAIKG